MTNNEIQNPKELEYFDDKTKDLNFTIESSDKFINITPLRRDTFGYNSYEITCNTFNIIEIAYRYDDDEHGWGAGVSEYITTQDIETMSYGIQKINNMETMAFSHKCLNGILKIHIEVTKNGYITLVCSILDTLERTDYISVSLNNLTVDEFKEITQPIIEWEKEFPTLWVPISS